MQELNLLMKFFDGVSHRSKKPNDFKVYGEQLSIPSTYKRFQSHGCWAQTLSGDVAMSIDASALDTHLRKTKLAGINSIIVLKLIKYEDFKLYVYKHINKYIHT